MLLHKHNLHISTRNVPLMTRNFGVYLVSNLHMTRPPVGALVPHAMYLMISGESLWNLALALENYKAGRKVAFAEVAVGRLAVVY